MTDETTLEPMPTAPVAPARPAEDRTLPLHVLNKQAKEAYRGARDDAHLIGQAAETAAVAVMAGATFNRAGKRERKLLRAPPT